MNQLEERLADLFSGGELIRMIFSSKRKKICRVQQGIHSARGNFRPSAVSGRVYL